MTTKDIANRFYALSQEGKFDEIQNQLYSKDAKSIEPAQALGLKSVSGLDNIKLKGKEWNEMIQEVHGGYTNEPQVAGNFFTCTMGLDVTMKQGGRIKLDEVAIYEVKDGKIVMEQFFF